MAATPAGWRSRWATREVAYLAGFTVRIGQLLMAQAAPTDGRRRKRLSTPGERWAREFEFTGITHAAATAELASRWGFPERPSARASATAPLESRPFSVLAAIVCLSTHLADAGEFDVPFDDIIASLPAGLCDHLRLDLADWSAELPTYDALADVAASLG
jgi:HD-like signal output (HDOD) protein